MGVFLYILYIAIAKSLRERIEKRKSQIRGRESSRLVPEEAATGISG